MNTADDKEHYDVFEDNDKESCDMIIHIETPNLELPEILQHRIEKKIQFTFKRLELHIHEISVSLNDVNGPKGGRDKACRIQIKNDLGSDVVIKGVYESLYKAIEAVCDRAKQVLSNQIDKKHRLARRQELEVKLANLT